MVSLLTYSKTEQDAAALKKAAKELIAKVSEDYWEIRQIFSLEDLREYLSDMPLIHLLIYDICDSASMEFLWEIRRAYKQTMVMIVADTSVSPMAYIKPGLRASSLLLKPWTMEQMHDVLHEFFAEYLTAAEEEQDGTQSVYVAETKEGTINIPYEQIYFFEAREKKIYVCAGKEEFGFYSTIDKLARELPTYFVRCHRGFIVNRKKIRRLALSQNTLYLSDGFDVPLSRSYKAAIKEMVK